MVQLKRSLIYRDFEQAFREMAGVPVTPRPIEAFDLSHQGRPERRSVLRAHRAAEQIVCRGPWNSSVASNKKRVATENAPLLRWALQFSRAGAGWLRFCKPDGKDFANATRQLLQFGAEMDVKRLKNAYFQTRVVSKKRIDRPAAHDFHSASRRAQQLCYGRRQHLGYAEGSAP